MPSLDDYYIQMTINNQAALQDLDAAIAKYRKSITNDRGKQRGYKRQGSKDKIGILIKQKQVMIKNLVTLRKKLKADQNSELNNIGKDNVEKYIVKNIKRRFNRKFKSGGFSNEKVPYAKVQIPRTGRYRHALEDPEFTKFESNRLGLNIGVVSKQKMDEWTNIHFNSFGDPYEPPTNYGDIFGYWFFQEFTGSGPKDNFRDFKSHGFVVQNVGLGGFKKRPIMLNSKGELDADDEKVGDGITRDISKMIRPYLKLI